jgi:hypothetical protein
VVAEVDLGLLDPVRVVEAERDLGEPPAQRRQQRAALLDQRPDLATAEPAARRGRGVEDRERADVTRLARVLAGP